MISSPFPGKKWPTLNVPVDSELRKRQWRKENNEVNWTGSLENPQIQWKSGQDSHRSRSPSFPRDGEEKKMKRANPGKHYCHFVDPEIDGI